LRICSKCTLNDNIPSVRIDDEGVCNYCRQSSVADGAGSSAAAEAEKKEMQFISECEKYRDLPYQVLLAYSGGKDSTYTLCLLRKKYGLSVLTATFDNGFLTEQCRTNIHNVTASLGVDNITIKPSFSKLARIFCYTGSREVFPKKALERASSICTSCIGMVKAAVLKEAVMRRIPFVSFGWTPGQVNLKASMIKLDHKMILANQKQIEQPITDRFGPEYANYFLNEEWLDKNKDYIPTYVYPLVFSQYNEEAILEEIKKTGWVRPEDTDMNSTNCLLNSYANMLHDSVYGYNPYSLEIANLVRSGFMSRGEGLKKISEPGDRSVVDYVESVLAPYMPAI
jgi:predicted PP-loop superfamily ATPase